MTDKIKVTIMKLGADTHVQEVDAGATVCDVAQAAEIDARGCIYQVGGVTVEPDHKVQDGEALYIAQRVEGGE